MSNQDKKLNIAYTIPLSYGWNLDIKQSANAWWMDKDKVYKMINAFKYLATVPEACQEANISIRQYKYFAQTHPEIKEVREKFTLIPSMEAKVTIINAIKSGDLKAAKWWLLKKSPEEFYSSLAKKDKTYRDLQQQIRDIQQRERGPEINVAVKEFEEKMRLILTKKRTE